MPPDETLVNRVRTAIGKNRRVQEKKMFGGIAFMVEGKMCVTVGKGRIMCRIDPAKHDTALERNGCTTVVMKGREYRGYVHIDADALSTKRDLNHWVKLALDFNSRAKASTRKRQ
jgi:TfoX/Sxy family transcriptional regulator of competence genes